MAKRKRLTPAGGASAAGAAGPGPEARLETKGMFRDAPVGKTPDRALGRRSAPIAEIAAETARDAALDELAESWAAARREGRLVMTLPLSEIRLDHLERDRLAEDPEAAASLRESLRRRGQQTPVEVVALPGGAGYGLLSGWRRCRALAALHAETGEDRFARVQALMRAPGDAPAAYVAMVEENEIRADLSHYERARIVAKAAEAGIYPSERAALSGLFAAASRARRSKIGSFLGIVHALDGALRFPEALSERAGLDLAQALREAPALAETLRAALAAAAPKDAAAERQAIADAVAAARMPATVSATVPDGDVSQRNAAQAPGARDTPAPPGPGPVASWPGLRLDRDRRGRLVLEGADPALEAALVAWLAARAGG